MDSKAKGCWMVYGLFCFCLALFVISLIIDVIRIVNYPHYFVFISIWLFFYLLIVSVMYIFTQRYVSWCRKKWRCMMSMYDTVEQHLQVKCTSNPSLKNYKIGDEIPLSDGLYLCSEGWFVVLHGIVLEASSIIFDKWGNPLAPGEIIKNNNPILQVIEELEAESKNGKDGERL